jgi:hypothetical protein
MLDHNFDPWEALQTLNDNQQILNDNQHRHAATINSLTMMIKQQQRQIDILSRTLQEVTNSNKILLEQLSNDIQATIKGHQ